MPTRKQRRRQQKSRRHEYEYVYVDEEGHEVEVDPADLRTAKEERVRERPKAGQRAPRRGRTIQPPSWRRAGRRGLIFAPFIILFAYLVRPNDAAVAGIVFQALILLAFFVPFSYFTDSLAYRMYRKRLERGGGGGQARGAKGG